MGDEFSRGRGLGSNTHDQVGHQLLAARGSAVGHGHVLGILGLAVVEEEDALDRPLVLELVQDDVHLEV